MGRKGKAKSVDEVEDANYHQSNDSRNLLSQCCLNCLVFFLRIIYYLFHTLETFYLTGSFSKFYLLIIVNSSYGKIYRETMK